MMLVPVSMSTTNFDLCRPSHVGLRRLTSCLSCFSVLLGHAAASDTLLLTIFSAADIAAMLGCTRRSLNVVATSRGEVVGSLFFEVPDRPIVVYNCLGFSARCAAAVRPIAKIIAPRRPRGMHHC